MLLKLLDEIEGNPIGKSPVNFKVKKLIFSQEKKLHINEMEITQELVKPENGKSIRFKEAALKM